MKRYQSDYWQNYYKLKIIGLTVKEYCRNMVSLQTARIVFYLSNGTRLSINTIGIWASKPYWTHKKLTIILRYINDNPQCIIYNDKILHIYNKGLQIWWPYLVGGPVPMHVSHPFTAGLGS